MTDPTLSAAQQPRPWLPQIAFGIGVIGMLLIGVHAYQIQRDQTRASVEAQLRAVGELRIEQITRWLKGIEASTRYFSRGNPIAADFEAWAEGDYRDAARAESLRRRMNDFQDDFGYFGISLFDKAGVHRLSDHFEQHMASHRNDVLQAINSDKTVLVDFHIHQNSIKRPMLGIVSPLEIGLGNGARSVGAAYISIPPEKNLLPLLANWPTPSVSSETVLARVQGNRMQFVYASLDQEARHPASVAIEQQSVLLSVRILRGEHGILRGGSDYRGKPVLAFGDRVPGTPWILIAKQDQEEADAPLLKLAGMTALVTVLLILVSGFMFRVWWRKQSDRQQTQLVSKESERRVLQRRYDMLARYASDVIVLIDAAGSILEINEKAMELYGYALNELQGKPLNMLRPPETRQDFEQRHGEIMAAGYLEYESEHQHKNGNRFPVQVNARVIDVQGVPHCHLLIRDLTAHYALQAKLLHQRQHHALTGLPNVNWLLQRLDEICAAAEPTPRHMALLVLNIDRFAQLNDNLGRASGDLVLISLARRWRELLPADCPLVHLSGDQFAVLHFPDGDIDDAREIAARLHASMRKPLLIETCDKNISLSLSIGVALFPDDAREASALLHAAEDAMRVAKVGKGNQVRFFDQDQAQRGAEWFEIENALRVALDQNQLFLTYQPQVDAKSGRVEAVEALLRWRRGDAVIPPGRFIHVVEGTDLAEPVSRWVLDTACRQARQWLDRQRPLRVAVNIFSDHVTSGHLVDDVRQALEDCGLPAQLLELEVVESSLLADPEAAARTLRELKRMGVSLALDDFGTGYSSLGYLKHYPFDVLKIDQMFTRNVNRDPEDAAIVRSTISLAHNLGMHVLAEGVETESQLRFMARYGCDHLQGYLLSRPTSPEAVETDIMQRLDLRPAGLTHALPNFGVLVLEDEPTEILLLSTLLLDAGYRVHVAETMQGALDLMGSQSIDLIVADYYLEQITGVDILHRLRGLYPEIPAVMLSGATEQSVVLEALNRGGIRAFLSKPVQPDALLATLHDLLGERNRITST